MPPLPLGLEDFRGVFFATAFTAVFAFATTFAAAFFGAALASAAGTRFGGIFAIIAGEELTET
jgi:hypothetical protein